MTELDREALLPCPFCGNGTRATVVAFDGESCVPGFVVRCDAAGEENMPNKGCGAEGGWGETPEEAIAAWNRRAPALSPKADDGREPDYCFDPDSWEYTAAWEDRHVVAEEMALGEIRRICTLALCTDKWAAHVPTTWDDDGDPDESEVKWFDSEEAAQAALVRP